jgi:biopolymer transport protein ExbB/TolQ
MQYELLFKIIEVVTYAALAGIALWGAFCAALVWLRVSRTRFRSEDDQDLFLDELDARLNDGRHTDAIDLCADDRRAMTQLALYAIENRDQGAERLERQLAERFQLDVLADVEHRLSWVSTVIKVAPMIGLLGTVTGMMGAFANLSTGSKVDTGKMAEDIMFALITTAIGLTIAVPLLLAREGISARIRKMEDLVAAGLSRLLETLRLR